MTDTAQPADPAAPPSTTADPAPDETARRLRRRRRIGWAMIGVGALIVLCAIWIVVTALWARSQLEAARGEVHVLRAQLASGDLAAARKTLAQLRSHADRAHTLTTGPIWALAADLPAGGQPLHSIRTMTAAIDAVAGRTLPQLIDARERLRPGELRAADGTVNVAAIAAVAPSLARADVAMTSATREVQHLPQHTWLGPVDHARADLLGQLTGLASSVRTADVATHVLPPMLGQHGVKRYFVGFQNDAEARGTGGLPGAFGILQVADGRMRFVRFENDSRIAHVPTGLDFGSAYDELYGAANTTSLYVNSNLSPHFPYPARIWTAMWQQATGQRLDGAIAVDPVALSYLLAVTGPAVLPDKTQVGADNVVALTQSTVYAKFPTDIAARKRYLLDVAKAVSRQVVDTHAAGSNLLDALERGAAERRLLVWSADPALEAQLAQTEVSGVVPETDAPYAGLSIVNDGGNKLDYYLDRSLKWDRTGCGPSRQVTVTVQLTNNAPASGLPPYVTARSDDHTGYRVRPGDNRLLVSYFATHGAQLRSVSVDGRPATASAGESQGHPVYIVDLELPRGTTQTIVFHLEEPAGTGAPVVLRQPLVRPLRVTTSNASCP